MKQIELVSIVDIKCGAIRNSKPARIRNRLKPTLSVVLNIQKMFSSIPKQIQIAEKFEKGIQKKPYKKLSTPPLPNRRVFGIQMTPRIIPPRIPGVTNFPDRQKRASLN